MARIPYNPKKGQTIKSDVDLVPLERVFHGAYHLTAAQAATAAVKGILGDTELTTARTLTTGFNDPPCPRALTYDCTVAGVTGNVTVVGTNIADEAITETKALNGTTVVPGVLAFKTITSIALPAKVHTKAKQSFTKQVTHKADAAGNVTLSMAGAALSSTPQEVVVAVLQDDTAAQVAAKMITALNLDAEFAAAYTASLSGTDKVLVTADAEAANDGTMALSFTDTGTTGVTMGADGEAVTGVAPDLVFIGFGDILGLPKMTTWKNVTHVKFNGVLETSAWAQVNDANELEKNTIDLNSALDGSAIDIYMMLDNE